MTETKSLGGGGVCVGGGGACISESRCVVTVSMRKLSKNGGISVDSVLGLLLFYLLD